ncbi:MAG: Fic family protein [Candidatus Paceibacterota bacterium]|jgi:Fic family protein
MSFNPIYPIDLAFLPTKEPLKNEDFSEVLLKARVELAELKGAAGQIPNPLLLTAPLLVRESVESSGVENINTTVVKVLENQLLPKDEQHAPDKEVLRYREALYWGAKAVGEFSLSNRTILGIHKQLIEEHGGMYRREQNHIVNSKTGEILYTPPLQERIPELIGNWEKFVNDSKELDPLIRAAIAHQQFESIHPFLDGNGRTGRILTVLQLVRDEILDYPILFISDYINKNRNEYYRLLRGVSMNDEWKEYISFMLQGFYLQAKETKETLKNIIVYHHELKQKIKTEHSKIYSAELIEALFLFPVITPTKLAEEIGIHYTTASGYLKTLETADILHSMKVGRNHFYVNKKLVKMLSK